MEPRPSAEGPFQTPAAPLDPGADAVGRARRTRWRILVFIGTALAYGTYYLTRKNYAIAQPAFMAELGWTKEQVGSIITGYLSVYAIGQFLNGMLGDRLGARVMLAIGFTLTAVFSFCLGFGASIGVMALLYGLNGYAQSTGWPSVTRAMTNWFTVEERGRVMGGWGMCYPAGETVATALASFVLGELGWRYVFWVPALIVLAIGALCVMIVRDHPRDVGLTKSGSAPAASSTRSRPASSPAAPGASWKHIRDYRVLTIGLAYFCLKFLRYTFTYWIGIYLVERMGFSASQAGYMQVPLPFFGAAGSLAAGFLSDKIFSTRRAPPAALMLAGLTGALIAFLVLPPSATAVTVLLGIIGFMIYGPDMLFSTAAAMDFGSEEAAATVTGFVNGLGSIGAALSGWLVGLISTAYGWPAVFYVLIGMAVACAATTLPIWNARGE